MLAKSLRLNKKNLSRLFTRGKKFREDFLLIRFLKNNLENNRFSVIISKKVVAKATLRNRLKRKTMAVLQVLNQTKNEHYDIAIIFARFPQMTDRLSSRFGMGMVADIQPPNLELRQAILRAKCEDKNFTLADEVIDYIAKNIESNIRELEGAINRLISFSQMKNTSPSLDMTQKALADIIASKNSNLSVDKILQITTDFFKISTNDLLSPRRNKELVRPRQIIMYLLRHEMSLSYPKIGQHLNKKDHTTVIHGVEKIEKEIARDEELHRQLTLLKEKLHSFD